MALINTLRPPDGGSRPLPYIYIDIFQPDDFGEFVIEVSDPSTTEGKLICRSQLPPDYSNTHYTQTARLLEGGIPNEVSPEWKQTPRYAEMVRYGRKLYTELFGTSDTFAKYVKRTRHLQNGFQFQLRLFNTASELWNVPWEYAHDGEMFLVGERGWPMSRMLRGIQVEEDRQITRALPRPLCVLVVLSDPSDALPLNAEQEIANIHTALGEAESRGFVVVDFVEEGSLHNLDLALMEREYHILHYIGHGAMTHKGSCLVMEGEDGRSTPAHTKDLMPILQEHPSLKLILLNACRTGQADESVAVNNVAANLLSLVPAVVTMQFALRSAAAMDFTRAFYMGITAGHSLENALQAARTSIRQKNESSMNWGMPALYVRQSALRLIDAQTPPVARNIKPFALDILPKPKVFVGRRDQQRTLRALLPQLSISSAYIWGLPGIGKSALVRRVIERPGRIGILSDVCVIDCKNTAPREMMTRLTEWLTSHFPKSGDIMRNPLLQPDMKIKEVMPLIRGRRLVLVIDHFDALLKDDSEDVGVLTSRPLQDFFTMLASAQWSVLTLFTSRRYWNMLPELTQKRTKAVHLREIDADEVRFLLGQSEHLQHVAPAGQNKLLETFGGHVGTLQFIESAISRDPSRVTKIDDVFIRALLKRLENEWLNTTLAGLSPADIETLTAASFLNRGFWSEHVRYLTRLPNNYAAEQIMVRWEMRGVSDYMFDDEDKEPWYNVPTVIRAMLRYRQSEAARKKLHQQAADAIVYNLCRSAQRLNENHGTSLKLNRENLFSTALGYIQFVIRRAPLPVRERIIAMALDWRLHWLEAEHDDRARDVINAVWYEMAFTFGQFETARTLLLESLKTANNRETLPLRASLTRLGVMQGKTENALEQFAVLAAAFAKSGDSHNQAAMLSEQGKLLAAKNVKKAVQLETEALNVLLKTDDTAAIADSYRTLASYRQTLKDPNGALKMTEQAWEYAEKSGDMGVMAAVMLTRGSLLLRLNEFNDAGRMLESAIDYAKREGDLGIRSAALAEFAEIHTHFRNFDTAAHYLLDAVELSERHKDNKSLVPQLYRLAETQVTLRAYADAQATAERAMSLAHVHRPDYVVDIQNLLQQIAKAR